MNRAFITGVAGQDGSYLAELLLSKGYEVTGLVRPSGDDRLGRLKPALNQGLKLVWGDLLDPFLAQTIALSKYDEVYHLAAMTHVGQSFKAPTLALETNASATLRLMDSLLHYSPNTRMYFAATSEMFGHMPKFERATESYPLGSRSPYATAKVAAYLNAQVYRKQGLFISCGIGFNHESVRRGENFVTRKVGLGVRRFVEQGGPPVQIGNLGAMRDWHHAKDMANGMWLALQHRVPDNFVFSSGESRTVRELCDDVCSYFNVPVSKAIEHADSELRPWDVEYLCGDPTYAERTLGWKRTVDWFGLLHDVCRREGEL